MNTGYAIKEKADGFYVEFFSMNSSTLEVNVIESRGPFDSKEHAERTREYLTKQSVQADRDIA